MRDIEVEFVPAASPLMPKAEISRSKDRMLPVAAYVIPVLAAVVGAVPVAAICALANIGVAGGLVASLSFGSLGFAAGLFVASMFCGSRPADGALTGKEFHQKGLRYL